MRTGKSQTEIRSIEKKSSAQEISDRLRNAYFNNQFQIQTRQLSLFPEHQPDSRDQQLRSTLLLLEAHQLIYSESFAPFEVYERLLELFGRFESFNHLNKDIVKLTSFQAFINSVSIEAIRRVKNFYSIESASDVK